MKELDQTKKKRLRAAAHHLKPVVMLGNRGYTDSVGAAIDEALGAHELIKVRLRGIEADDRDATVTQICNTYKAIEIARIGAIVVLYRENPDDPSKS